MKYYYIHGISYWVGNNRTENIKLHADKIKCLDLPEGASNLCIVSLMCDDTSSIDKNLISLINNLSDESLEVDYLINFNSGGTVQSMQHCYKYLKQNNITSNYFGCWEDDFCFLRPTFIQDIKYYLDNYLFVGSMWEDEWFNQDPNEFKKNGKKKFLHGIDESVSAHGQEKEKNNYCWCEDPYVMKFENLEKIENLIGEFTLAPTNERYQHGKHGIALGEVGFPTRLKLAGGDFFGLMFDEYYTFFNTESLGGK